MAVSKTKSAFLLSISQNINLVLSIVSTSILARLFTTLDLGVYKQTTMVFELLQPFFLLSIPEALYFFLPKENSEKYMFNTFVLVTFSGLLTFLILFFGRNIFASQFNNISLNDTLKIYSLFALFYFPIQVLTPILIFYEKASKMAVWVCLTNFLMILSIIITALVNCSYSLILLVRVIVQGLITIFSLVWVIKIIKPNFRNFVIDFSYLFQIFKYALPLGLTSLMGTLCVRMDKLVVSMFVAPEEFAIYSNGAMEVPFINSITGSVSAVIIVEYVRLYQEGKFQDIINLFKKCAYKTSIFLFPIMIYFAFWKNEFIVTLYSEKYLDSALLFFIYLFTIPVRIVQYGPVIQAMNKNTFLVIRSVGDLIINILLNFIFIKLLGMKGAAIATVLVLYLWTVPFNMIVISKGLHTKLLNLFPWKKLTLNLLASLIIVYFSQAVRMLNINILFQLVISVLFCILLYIPYLYYTDRDSVKSIISILRR